MKKWFLLLVFSGAIVLGWSFLHNKPCDRVWFESEFNKGAQLLLKGEYQTAIDIFATLIAADDSVAAVHFNAGRAYAGVEDWDNAIRAFTQAQSLNRGLQNLTDFQIGYCYEKKGDSQRALEFFKRVTESEPAHKEAAAYCYVLSERMGLLEHAFEYLKKAVTLDKNYAVHFNGLGIAFRDKQDFKNAIQCYKASLQYHDNFNTYLLLGDAYNMDGDQETAIAMYTKAIELNPQSHEAYNNIGTIYGTRGEFEKTKKYLLQALVLNPNHAGVHAGLSALYLAQGDFINGWREYEWRLNDFFSAQRQFKTPRWDGVQDVCGKRVLVHAEQGLGDTFHFIRYAQLLKDKGAIVIAEVQKPLIKIIALCPYVDAVIMPGQQVDFDLHAPLMSMPYLCKTTINTIPAKIPYLYADQSLQKLWRDRITKNKFTIGVCWHVDASHDADVYRGNGRTVSVMGSKRSLPIDLVSALAEIPGVQVYSLQKGPGAEELKRAAVGQQVIDFGNELDTAHGSFMDTAALMQQLDLVVSADTSIAHLAGGLGVPVWILVPYPAEWRWLLERSDSPWYPSMRIFRREKGKGWDSVIAQVKQALILQLAKRQ